jgi:hypothetical protein
MGGLTQLPMTVGVCGLVARILKSNGTQCSHTR